MLGLRKFSHDEVGEGFRFHNTPVLRRLHGVSSEIDSDAKWLPTRGIVHLQECIDAMELIERSTDGRIHAHPVELVFWDIERLDDRKTKLSRELLLRICGIPRLEFLRESYAFLEGNVGISTLCSPSAGEFTQTRLVRRGQRNGTKRIGFVHSSRVSFKAHMDVPPYHVRPELSSVTPQRRRLPPPS